MGSRIISKAIDLTNRDPDANRIYITEITANNGIRIHPASTENNSIVINSTGVELFKGGTTRPYSIAKYGDTTRIGKEGSSRFLINNTSLQAYNNIDDTPYFEVNSNGLTWGSNTAATTTQVDAAAQTATSFLSYDPTNGLNIASSSPSTATRKVQILSDAIKIQNDNNNYLRINSNGLNIYKSGVSVASFTDSAINIGKLNTASNALSSGISLNAAGVPMFEVTTQYGDKPFLRFGDLSVDRTYYGGEQYIPGTYSASFGNHTMATGDFSVAEGCFTSARGHRSHAEGCTTLAGTKSHPKFGSETGYAHAEGHQTQAWGDCSHAQNESTIASGNCQTAIGRYNLEDTSVSSSSPYGTYVFMIGNGYYTGNDWNWASSGSLSPSQQGYGPTKNQLTQVNTGMTVTRRNAFTVNWSGNTWCSGSYSNGSDKRLKTHVNYLDTDAIKFIRKLKPAHFIKNDEHHTGFYAQDIQEIDPWGGLVGQDASEYLTLCYTDIIAPLVTYCQHLEERIKQLEENK